MQYEEKEALRKSLFRVGCIVSIFPIAGIFYITFFHGAMPHYPIPCVLYTLTGYYCPGCGGTRAVFALFQGQLLRSMQYNIIVVYFAALYICFMVSNAVEKISRHRLRIGMYYHGGMIAVGIAAMLLQCIYKNIMYR